MRSDVSPMDRSLSVIDGCRIDLLFVLSVHKQKSFVDALQKNYTRPISYAPIRLAYLRLRYSTRRQNYWTMQGESKVQQHSHSNADMFGTWSYDNAY